MKVTFLVPSNRPSGGIRVTMQMGNCLVKRGHSVRIAYRSTPVFSMRRVRQWAKVCKLRFEGVTETRWLNSFNGPVEDFVDLNDLLFETREIVISTGVHTIQDLIDLKHDVLKVRYCHGLLDGEPEHIRKMWLWKGPMDTIAVSPVLIPELERNVTGRILGVVSNGISPEEYFPEDRVRDAVGFIYGQHPVKGPEVALGILSGISERFSGTPVVAFGTSRRVPELKACDYTRFPSVSKARELYNRSKVWLVTSRDEGFCLPILEAMACGCAVISSQHTNAAQLIENGVNGFTVPFGDVDAYLNLIGRLLRDETLRSRVVKAGFEVVERFTWEAAADQMERTLEKALLPDRAGRASAVGACA